MVELILIGIVLVGGFYYRKEIIEFFKTKL
jgi:hypothetical protein